MKKMKKNKRSIISNIRRFGRSISARNGRSRVASVAWRAG
jgi:hypothetical protein